MQTLLLNLRMSCQHFPHIRNNGLQPKPCIMLSLSISQVQKKSLSKTSQEMRSGTMALICRPLNGHSAPTIFSCLPYDNTPCIQHIFVNPRTWARDKSIIWMDGCLGTRSWIGELTLILFTSRWLIPICVLIRQWVFCVRLRTTLTLNLWFGICTASRSSPLITVGDHQPTYCMSKCMHFTEMEWFHNSRASNLSHIFGFAAFMVMRLT